MEAKLITLYVGDHADKEKVNKLTRYLAEKMNGSVVRRSLNDLPKPKAK